MEEACHVMRNGEILNEEKTEYPLYEATLYGDRVLTQKLTKRLGCSIKHLPIRIKFNYEYDTLKAIEKGIRKDPTLVLNGKIFLDGLPTAEEITEKFENLIKKGI